MKLHFEPNLDYQMQAIEAVCDLFRGQEVCRTEFTVTMKLPDEVQMSLGVAQSDLGVGNRLTLLDDELLKNLADIQLRGGLPPSGSLTSGDFTVEMETGTGRRLQDPANHRGTLQGALRGRALRLLPVRLGQARAGAQFRH